MLSGILYSSDERIIMLINARYFFGFIGFFCGKFLTFSYLIEEPFFQGICLLPGGQKENCIFKHWKAIRNFLATSKNNNSISNLHLEVHCLSFYQKVCHALG